MNSQNILNQKQTELEVVNKKISTLEGTQYKSDDVAKFFPLGRVGGSGRNTHRLNKQRERDLDKTIENSKKSTELHKHKNRLEIEIKQLIDGTWKSPDQRKQERKERNKLAQKIEKENDKNIRNSMTFEERLFIGDYPGGMVYCDKAVMQSGDYKKLAFRSRSTGEVTWYAKRIPTEIREMIEQDIRRR
jgi:hypothetical protein